MINKDKLLGLIGLATKAGKITFGTEASKGAIEKSRTKLVIITTDASNRTKSNFKEICKKNNIPIYECLETNELSKAIGKENKSVVGINDVNFSKAILKIINGGEVIG